MTKPQGTETESEVRDALQLRIRTEGVLVAYDTALGICRDAEAPAPAKATALTALFRVAGYFEKSEVSTTQKLSELSADELAAMQSKLARKLATWEAEPERDGGADDNGGADGADNDGVFG